MIFKGQDCVFRVKWAALYSTCAVQTAVSSDQVVPPRTVVPVDHNEESHAAPSVSQPSSPRAYMFPLRIPEQLTMSMIHFHQFLNLVNDWNFTGVEPFTYDSFMFGLRSLHSDDPHGSLPFSKLFDSRRHNEYLSKCMGRQNNAITGNADANLFEPMSEFLRRSYRRFVLVYFAGHGAARTTLPCHIQAPLELHVESGLSDGQFSDCTAISRTYGLFRYVENLLTKEVELERLYPSSNKSLQLSANLSIFRGVQAFCIKKTTEISLRNLRDYVFRHLNRDSNVHNVSIIFTSWQGRFTHPLIDDDIKNYINKCRTTFSQPFHSDFVSEMASRYVDSLGFKGKPYLSVHVRFEKLYLHAKERGKSIDVFLDCCVRRLNSLISLLTVKYDISKENILLNWDYSPYGTIGCPIWRCGYTTNKYLQEIAARSSYFEPSKFGVSTNRGFISLVEMNALFGGKALITVGEGSYQYTIGETFIDRHRDTSSWDPKAASGLHYGSLCMPQENLHELPGMLSPYC